MEADTYISKQVEITAKMWDGSAVQAGEIIEWMEENGWGEKVRYKEVNETAHKQHAELRITTLEGIFAASPGWWIIRGTEGEFYPCKPSVFEAKYDRIPQ